MLQHEIRRLRKAKGWSQETLAKELHMTQHALSQYETGKRAVPLETFEKILKTLGVQIQFNLSDEVMNQKVVASLFFEKWDSMEERFPDWDAEHSGGGIWILRKDFRTKEGQDVLVSVADTGAMVHKKIERDETSPYGVKVVESYIPLATYKKEADMYWEFESLLFETVFQIGENGWTYAEVAATLFDEETLEELEYHAQLLSQF